MTTPRSAAFAAAALLALAMTTAALAPSGCNGAGGKGCGIHCGGDPAYVEVPNLMQMEIQRVDTDPPCMASVGRVGNDGHEAAVVWRDGAGTCRIIIHLANQDTYVSYVEFATHDCACGGMVTDEIDASVPELVLGHDAGTD